MAALIQAKNTAGDVVVPAAGGFPATVIPGLRSFLDTFGRREYAGGSLQLDDAHLAAILALHEGSETRRGFLDAIVTINLPGYTAPNMLRAINNTPMTVDLPAYGGYSHVMVQPKSTALVFAGHRTALLSHPEYAVARALSLLTFDTV